MPTDRIEVVLRRQLAELDDRGTTKRVETVVRAVLPATGETGPRYLLAGHGDVAFLRMSSNGYLGLALHPAVIAAEEAAARAFGSGPGAVRFISGTFEPHVELERRLAEFHGREAALIFSSAYAAVVSVLPSLVTPDTAVVSDSLNHNCIINATRLAQPSEKVVYPHLDLAELDRALGALDGSIQRVLVVTDGVFSMRGDHAPLDAISAVLARARPSVRRERSARRRRLARRRCPRHPRAGHRGGDGRARRRARRHAGQGARRERRLRRRQPHAGGPPAGDGPHLHLLEPGDARRSRRGAGGARSARQRDRQRVARPPARHHRPLPRRVSSRSATRPSRASTPSSRCSCGTRPERTSSSPTSGPTACSPPGSATRSCPGATRRSGSRSPPTTRRPTSTRCSPSSPPSRVDPRHDGGRPSHEEDGVEEVAGGRLHGRHAFDEVPAGFIDLANAPPVAALTTVLPAASRRRPWCGVTTTAPACGSTRCAASARSGTCAPTRG